MKNFDITFLGSCACDFSPRLDGELSRTLDKDARRSSSMMIDGRYIIDFGPHPLDVLDIIGKDKSEITDIIITHTHSDHFDPEKIKALALGRRNPLRLWTRQGALEVPIEGVELHEMELFKQYQVGELLVTGMSANHDASACPQHLLIEKNGEKIFYGCDGAWLLNDTYYHLVNASLSLAVLDCTVGDYEGDYRLAEHNSIPMIRLMLPSLKTIGAINENTKIYLSHIAPSLHACHEDTVEIAHAIGVNVAYDGLRIEI